VTVVNLDWHEDNKKNVVSISEKLKVISVLPVRFKFFPRILNRGLSWSVTSLVAFFYARKYMRAERYDTLIMTTPLTIFSLFLLAIKSRNQGDRIALCWDVFPIQDLIIGPLPKALVPAIKKWEERLYNSCAKIFVLSDDYRRFLKNKFNISDKIEIINSGLWGGALPCSYDMDKGILPCDGSKVIVFGGQFVAGRGMDNFLMLCRVAAKVDNEIKVLVISSGDMLLRFYEIARLEKITNLLHLDPLSRASYAKVISDCMAGFISLEANTGLPAFPSKIVDYTRAGLPVIVVDNSNPAFKDFIESRGIGCYINCGDFKGLETAISFIVGNPDERGRMSENSRRVFEEEFDASRVASLIVPRSTGFAHR
jgi:glycosyltransferase involved in cell wall biosynthesis